MAERKENEPDLRCVECGIAVPDESAQVHQCNLCGHSSRLCHRERGAHCPCQSKHRDRYDLVDGQWRWCQTLLCSGTHLTEKIEQCERCTTWLCRMHNMKVRHECSLCHRTFTWCWGQCHPQRPQTYLTCVCRQCTKTEEYARMEDRVRAEAPVSPPHWMKYSRMKLVKAILDGK